MRFSTASPGRTFVLRLEHGEVLHDIVERFAVQQGITSATVVAVGGADRGSLLIVGPEHGAARPVRPMSRELGDVHEIAGVGTIFPNETGRPVLHMHAACGRRGSSVTGCVRAGVKAWVVLEVVIQELAGCTAVRKRDLQTGFELLEP
jgi:predicted DNA-binding protein with PD1-like motif